MKEFVQTIRSEVDGLLQYRGEMKFFSVSFS